MAENRVGGFALIDADDIAKFDDGALAGQGVRGNRCREGPFGQGQVAFWQLYRDLDRMPSPAAMRIADRNSPEVRLYRVIDVPLVDLEKLELILLDDNALAHALDTEAVVVIDDIGYRAENLAQLRGHRTSRVCVRAIDLRQQRRDHGRTRRHLDDLDGTLVG